MEAHKDKILDFYRDRKRMPTYSELSKLLGYQSKSAVSYAVDKLIDAGIISKDRKGRLIPRNLKSDIKLLGLVEAGFPSAAEEELVDTLSLDEFLIKNRDATYILKVKGDSMIDAGIFEGDLVLVERGVKPKVGQIVIAQVDGDYTMKYYREKSGKAYLEAANEKYPPIHPTSELKVEAVVRTVIRQY